MSRQYSLFTILLAATTTFVLLVGISPAVETSSSTPNIVLILVDDLGWRDVGCYGSTFYETPAIDRLASEGMRFTQAYAAAPVCSPTRASILTGRNPARVGLSGHITSILKYRYPPTGRIIPPQDHMRLRLEEVTLAEALKPLGYISASIGKWHLGDEDHWPKAQGFDINIAGNTHGSPPSYFDPYINKKRTWAPTLVTIESRRRGEYLTDRLTDEAVRFIESARNRPFFLYLSHYAVHTPIQAKPGIAKKYEAKLKSDRSQKNASYAAMIESVDESVGRVLNTISRLKLVNNTVVVFFSDNGGLSRVTNNAPLRGGKQTLYEGGLRVPLIVKWPGHTKPNSTCDTPVHSDDLFPTVMDIADRLNTVKQKLDGQSLVPLLSGKGRFRKRLLYWYYPHYARRPGYAVRDVDFKLIEHYDPPSVELFNIAADISEATNLAEQFPKRVVHLREQFRHWLDSVGATRHTDNPNRTRNGS